MGIYEYIATQFVGKTYHFVCDCLFPLDVIGKVVDTSMSGSELMLHIQVDKKMVKLGINHPNLTIEEL